MGSFLLSALWYGVSVSEIRDAEESGTEATSVTLTFTQEQLSKALQLLQAVRRRPVQVSFML